MARKAFDSEAFIKEIKEARGKSQRLWNEPGKDIFGAPLYPDEIKEVDMSRTVFYGVRELIGLKNFSNIAISAAEERVIEDDDDRAREAFTNGIGLVEEIIGRERTAIIEAFQEDYNNLS